MMALTPVQQKFILHWGRMGSQWGINRTVAQIHALLYLSPDPLNAEEIATLLGIARSNVSTSLWELQNWGIIQTVPVLGDRRDHFQSVKDVWEMFRTVLDERKKREVDPTLALLRECVEESRESKTEAETHKRLAALLDFFETMTTWYEQMKKLPVNALMKLTRATGKAAAKDEK